MSDSEKFKEELSSKEKFSSSLNDRNVNDRNRYMFLMFGINLNWKDERSSRVVFKACCV